MDATYSQQYLFVAALAGVAVTRGLIPLIAAKFIAPKKPGYSKFSPYECGMESTSEPWVQFRVQYYAYALLFVIFDVEIIFIFPWAIVWKGLGPVVFAEMVLFIAILAVGLIYAWRKGVLEWE